MIGKGDGARSNDFLPSTSVSGTLPCPSHGRYVLALRPACASCMPATLSCAPTGEWYSKCMLLIARSVSGGFIRLAFGGKNLMNALRKSLAVILSSYLVASTLV
jgi:hypothetical protein